MAIGNKCIIVCPPTTEAMFPFQEIPPCLLTAGNKSLLEIVLDRVSLISLMRSYLLQVTMQKYKS